MTDHESSDGQPCPLAGVDKRLEDAHRLWHQAEENYFDPEAFRLAAQNAIQTLRSVTFILQNHKRIIPDFDAWYEPWQERMRADPLMRWMVEARNKIEKQGDLEAQSFVHADIVASYLDEGPSIEVPANLFDDPSVLLRKISKQELQEQVMPHGTLRIKRRWVENTLPDYELLDALAIAYGKLAELVHDAHRQMGLPAPTTIDAGTGESFQREGLGWKMPCMIAHEDPRNLMISLADGSILSFERKEVHVDASRGEELKERYGDAHKAMGANYADEEALAAGYFEMVRGVFSRDGYHLPFVFLFKDKKFIKVFPAPAETRAQKYLLMRHLANEAARFGADAAIYVGEAWRAPAAGLARYQYAENSENREEALFLTLVTKEGEPMQFFAAIIRDGDEVSLGETQQARGGAHFMFAPFYEAWGRPLPEKWLATIRSMHGDTPSSDTETDD